LKTAAFSLSLAAALVLSLGACSKQEAPAAPTATAAVAAPITASSYDTVAATGKGFTVGALMSAQTAYVLFDPQCPHCGHLWQASLPLHNQMKFVWIPVAFNTGKSLSQAAALLSATNPAEAMTAHEQSLLAGNGGMAASSSVAPELAQAIKANTQLLTSMGVDSVPFMIAKDRRNGQVVSHSGAMDTAALSGLLGIN
jgi:thiol:disulfide interchange protein DsbG